MRTDAVRTDTMFHSRDYFKLLSFDLLCYILPTYADVSEVRQKFCLHMLIYLLTYQHISIALRQSDHVTSDHVMFCMQGSRTEQEPFVV